jgi:uncharacterized protein (TIGR02757 family)
MSRSINKGQLERLYALYNRQEYVHPDPLEFLYRYRDPLDREIVGLISSSLAYGQVSQIIKSVQLVLGRMPSPRDFLLRSSLKSLRHALAQFRHRFTSGHELACMLFGAGRILKRYGSLNECFRKGMGRRDGSVIPALSAFVAKMNQASGVQLGYLLPSPENGSACKRPNLFLRWMVRRDDVDPGGWRGISSSKLIVPLDTHMHKISLALGLTRRRQGDMRTALEITQAFRRFSPQDPAKYDFALTRLGIRKDVDFGPLLGPTRA